MLGRMGECGVVDLNGFARIARRKQEPAQSDCGLGVPGPCRKRRLIRIARARIVSHMVQAFTEIVVRIGMRGLEFYRAFQGRAGVFQPAGLTQQRAEKLQNIRCVGVGVENLAVDGFRLFQAARMVKSQRVGEGGAQLRLVHESAISTV